MTTNTEYEWVKVWEATLYPDPSSSRPEQTVLVNGSLNQAVEFLSTITNLDRLYIKITLLPKTVYTARTQRDDKTQAQACDL